MKRLCYVRYDGSSRDCICARPFAWFAVRRKGLVSFWAAITFFLPNATPAATSTGSGIAARYPGDKNIASDPAVIFADDFESYTSATQLLTKWTHAPGHAKGRLKISTAAGTFFAGKKGLEMNLPISTSK